jgi:hypothetical protein
MAIHPRSVSYQLGGAMPLDPRACLYNICNMLLFRRKIIRMFGDMQLEDLDAENVLADLFRNWKDKYP